MIIAVHAEDTAMLPTRLCKSFPVLLAIPLSLASVSGRSAEEHPPGDTCVLILTLPEGATVTVDGRDYGPKRVFTYHALEPNRFYAVAVKAGLAGGDTVERQVLIEGGRNVRLDIRVPPGNLPEMVVQKGHSEWINDVASSPDGKYVLTGSLDRTAILWDAGSGRLLREVETKYGVYAVAYSPNGRQIATGGGWQTNAELFLWDVTTGRRIRQFNAGWKVLSVQFSPDGKLLLTSGSDYKDEKSTSEVVLWNVATGKRLYTVLDNKEDCVVSDAVFSPDGQRFATCDNQGDVIVWKTATGTMERKTSKAWPGILGLAFHPDGQHIAFTYEEFLFVWNWKTDEEVCKIKLWPEARQYYAEGLAFSPDGNQLLTAVSSLGQRTSEIVLWNWQTKERLRLFTGFSLGIRCATFSPDGNTILAGGDDRSVLRWQTATGRQLQTYAGHARQISELLPLPDEGKLIVGTHYSTQSAIYDWTTGEKRQTVDFLQEQEEVPFVVHRALRSDGRRLFAAYWLPSQGEQAVYVTVPGNEKLHSLPQEQSADCVAISPNGRTLLTGFGVWNAQKKEHAAQALLWDAETGVRTHSLIPMHQGTIGAAEFTRDNRLVAIGSGRDEDSTISLWDVATGTKRRTFSGHQARVKAMDFSPDGRKLLSAGGSDYVPDAAFLWDVATGRQLRRLAHPEAPVMWDARFSSDGRLVVTGGGKTAIVWNADNGRLLRVFRGHAGQVFTAHFYPDDRHVLTGSADGTARLWDLATGEELARLISLDAPEDWLVVSPNGLFDGSATGRQKVSFRIGDGLNVVPVDRFFQDFYRPGLFAEILDGTSQAPTALFANRAAPKVRIASEITSGPVSTPQVTFQVEVTDQGGGVKGPWLTHNGARVLVTGEPVRKGKTVVRTFTVPLVEGENQLEIAAASEDGSWESEPATLVLQYANAVAAPRLHLVAVGISQYAEDTMRLKFAAADARAMAGVFAKRGPTFYGKDNVHITTIVDEHATKAGICDALGKVARTATPQDTVILFLAGHGTMLGQRYYFIPYEFKNQSATLEEDIRQQGLPGDDLDDLLRTVPALKRLVIYDTCHSGGAVAISRTARDPFAFRGALERMSRATGSFTIAATAAGAEAQEVPELKHGVLTYALLAGLGEVDAGPLKQQRVEPKDQKLVEVRDWFAFAQDKVPRLTGLYFGQEQFVGFSSHGESFPLLPVGKQP